MVSICLGHNRCSYCYTLIDPSIKRNSVLRVVGLGMWNIIMDRFILNILIFANRNLCNGLKTKNRHFMGKSHHTAYLPSPKSHVPLNWVWELPTIYSSPRILTLIGFSKSLCLTACFQT